jgi:hypothetical protein
MNFFFFHIPVKNRKDEVHKQTLVVDEEQHNITEGGEFLDDALRMKDQPLIYTEESVAAGSPEELR